MCNNWKSVPLKEICGFKSGERIAGTIGRFPIYGGNGILGYTNESNLNCGVIVGRVGAYCGSVYYVNSPIWVSDNAISITTVSNDQQVDIKFIYYFLRSKNINSMQIGTSQPLITQRILGGIDVKLPVLQEQKLITSILSVLDDKIENNIKINSVFEELAQTLFKRWFVDFEFPNEDGKPYKSSGGKMTNSEMRLIPEGWKFEKLGEIIEIYDNLRKPLSSREREFREKIYPYYGATSLMDYVDDYIFDGIHVLMGEDGSVINNLGYPFLQYVWGKFWVNNHAHVLKGKNGFNENSLYILLKNTTVNEIVTGAVQLKINQTNLKNLRIILPSEDILKMYNERVDSIFAKIRINTEENRNLKELRDILLPKLMNGEIRVPIDKD